MNTSMYPLSFENGGTITFDAVGAAVGTEVRLDLNINLTLMLILLTILLFTRLLKD